jgi:hypothetical protein
MLTILYGNSQNVKQRFANIMGERYDNKGNVSREGLHYRSKITAHFESLDYEVPKIGDGLHNKFIPIYEDVLDDSIAHLETMDEEVEDLKLNYDHQKISDAYLKMLASFGFLMTYVCSFNLQGLKKGEGTHRENCTFRHLYPEVDDPPAPSRSTLNVGATEFVRRGKSFVQIGGRDAVLYKLLKYRHLLRKEAPDRTSYEKYQNKVRYYESLLQ